MRKLVLVIVLMTCYLVLVVGNAGATHIVTFYDSTKYWSGWGPNNNPQDTVGIPDFTGEKAVISDDGCYLTKLTFDYTSKLSWADDYWWVLSPGDLFINVNSNSNWDYLVKLLDETPGPSNSDPGAG